MRYPRRTGLVLICIATVVSSCVTERIPDTPSNTAIHLVGALRQASETEVRSLLCDEVTRSNSWSIENPESFGGLAEFYEAVSRNWSEERGAFGGDSQYSPAEQVGLQVDQAWTEIDFIGEDQREVWRLHMVREAGKWKACSAEFRGVGPGASGDLRGDTP